MQPVWANDDDSIAGLGRGGPGRGRTRIGMNREIYINFLHVRTGSTHRVGAHWIAFRLGEGTPKLVPTVVDKMRKGCHAAVGHRENNLDALIITCRPEIGEGCARKRNPQQCGTDVVRLNAGCRKAPVHRGGAGADLCGRCDSHETSKPNWSANTAEALDTAARAVPKYGTPNFDLTAFCYTPIAKLDWAGRAGTCLVARGPA